MSDPEWGDLLKGLDHSTAILEMVESELRTALIEANGGTLPSDDEIARHGICEIPEGIPARRVFKWRGKTIMDVEYPLGLTVDSSRLSGRLPVKEAVIIKRASFHG